MPISSVGPEFELLEQLAEGGMATVYRARQTCLDRMVAVKVIDTRRVSRDGVERFQREARLASRMGHPNVVSIFSHGTTTSGSMWISMELLEGRTLADVLRIEGALSAFRAVRIARQILSGLAAAHQIGILHRDLKPSNVFLTRPAGYKEEHVKLLDFGLALHVTNPNPLTAVDHVVGTVGYMSPEQSAGHPLDPRSDLYSAGVLLHEMIFGRPLPPPPSLSHAAARSIAPAGLPQVPGALLTLIDQLVAFRPDERPASVQQVLEHLDRIETAPFSGRAPGPTMVCRDQEPPPRRPYRSKVALIIAAGAMIALIGWSLYSQDRGTTSTPTRADVSESAPAASAAVAATPTAPITAPEPPPPAKVEVPPSPPRPTRPAKAISRRRKIERTRSVTAPRGSSRGAKTPACPQGVSIESRPSNALVVIAGRRVGRTPLRRQSPSRSTRAQVRAPGFKPATVVIDDAPPCAIRVDLEVRDPTVHRKEGGPVF